MNFRRSFCKPKIFLIAITFFLFVQFLIYFAAFIKESDENKSNNQITIPCELGKHGQYAFDRSKSIDCKNLIARTECLQQITALDRPNLPNLCPLQGFVFANSGHALNLLSESINSPPRYIGCFLMNILITTYKFGETQHFTLNNSPTRCIKWCRNNAAPFAGLFNRTSCVCSKEFQSEAEDYLDGARWCQLGCPGGGGKTAETHCGSSDAMAVYATGANVINFMQADLVSPGDHSDLLQNRAVRIAFLLVLSGRSWRQVKRLFNLIYHVNHYYYIHVDQRHDYLHDKVSILVRRYPNVRMTSWRMATIWGGSSLLEMLLRAMRDLLDMADWKWNFFINLSESDLPIKSNAMLTAFLTLNRDKSFVRFSGQENSKFIRKQALNQLFVECDQHMWLLGSRELPGNVFVSGGSDWLTLNNRFVNYVVHSNDSLVTGLKAYFKYALLPAESFFHTVLQNSLFCESVINNNLHVTNWKRSLGCKCQHKNVVDWCGCSPNVFRRHYDLSLLKANKRKALFFARKFDSTVDVDMVNLVEKMFHGINYKNMVSSNSHWENIYSSQWDIGFGWDVYRTGFESLARLSKSLALGERDMKRRDTASCADQLWSLTDVTALFQSDTLTGLLVTSQVGQKEDGMVVETLMQLKRNRSSGYKRFQSDAKTLEMAAVRDRLVGFEIGVNCDPKEFIFRDYSHLIGSTSSISISITWSKGPPIKYIQFDFFDPSGTSSFQLAAEILETKYVTNCLTPQHASPLSPGKWRVVLVYNHNRQSIQLAENTFLVIPVAYHRGSPIVDGNVAATINHHVGNKKKSEDPSNWVGTQLTEYVDSMVSTVWKPFSHCIVSSASDTNKKRSSCFHLDFCESTSWSSFYPDPKTDLGSISSRTGLLTS